MKALWGLTWASLQLLTSLVILTPVVAALAFVAKVWWTIAILIWGTW